MLHSSVGDPEHFRSIAKSSLEVFALVEAVAARSDSTRAVRDYIVRGEGAARVNWTLDPVADLPFSAEELGAFSHVVTVWAQRGSPVLGHFTIFGHLHFLTHLADDWAGEPFAASLALDPLAERDLGLRRPATVPPVLDVAALASSALNATYEEKWRKFIIEALRVGHWRNVEWRLREIIGSITSSWAKGTILRDEHFAQLASGVVGMLSSVKFGSSTPIDLDDFKRRCGELFEKLAAGD